MSDDRRPHRAVRYGSPDGAVIDICRDVGRAEDSGFMNREMPLGAIRRVSAAGPITAGLTETPPVT
jgi:hypothetical protein